MATKKAAKKRLKPDPLFDPNDPRWSVHEALRRNRHLVLYGRRHSRQEKAMIRLRRASRWAVGLLFCCGMLHLAVEAGAGAQQPAASSSQAVGVDEVMRMLQVKLSDDLIIAQIQRNSAPMVLSTDDIVRLKTNGASDALIRAMLNPKAGAGSAASASVASGEPSPPDANDLPTVFGFYVSEAGKLAPLKMIPVITTFGLIVGRDRGFAVDGIAPTQQGVVIGGATPTIIGYDQALVPSRFRLSALSLVTAMTAFQFNILNTAPQFFMNVYGKSPTERVPINLLRPQPAIPLQIAPVDGKPGMYRLIPSSGLAPGKYVLYDTESLHEGDHVFTASPGRQTAAFLFEVRGTAVSSSAANATGVYAVLPDNSLQQLTNASGSIWIRFGGRRQIQFPAGAAHPTSVIDGGTNGFVLRGGASLLETECRIYSFTVRDDGAQAAEVNDALPCTVARTSADEAKLMPLKSLPRGYYAIGGGDLSRRPTDAPVSVYLFRVTN